MKQPNIIQEKTYAFSLEVIQFCRFLIDQKEFILSKQLCKSGTSIGANVEEAISAPTKKDFVHKLSISLKEANETRYWLRLIKDSGFTVQREKDNEVLLTMVNEIIALLTSIIKTTRASLDEE